MVCLFCGFRLTLERSLKDRWAVKCARCGFKGPDAEERDEPMRQYANTVEKIPTELKWLNDWARWRAADENGNIFEYEFAPVRREYDWYVADGRFELVFVGLGINWKNSLEKREECDE